MPLLDVAIPPMPLLDVAIPPMPLLDVDVLPIPPLPTSRPPVPEPLLDDVEAIELITSHELRLRLKRPSGYVLRALAEIPILPMHMYDGSLLAGGALVGTGPWKYVSNKGGVVHLTKNDKYWAGPPAISDLEFVYQPDAAAALTSAKHGELDIVPALIPAHWPEQATAPGVTASFKPLQLAPPLLRRRARPHEVRDV